MTSRTSSTAIALVFVLAAIAVAAPTHQGLFGGAGATRDPMLDSAALFRPAGVGECGAIAQRQVLPQPSSRDSKHTAKSERKMSANLSCDVVWTD